MRKFWLWLSLAAAASGALPAVAATTTIGGVAVEFRVVASGFGRPVLAISPPGGEGLLVVEKTGRVRAIEDGKPGAVFLDLSSSVSGGNEQGLLGLAFDPDYVTNGRLYVDYTDRGGDTQIVAYTAVGGVADPASAKTLLSIEQPAANHNGGWIAFGPDGLLYIATGDGGGGGDPNGNGQNKDVLLGKILRIDIRDGQSYAIPADNPFAKGGGAPEVYLYGLRNPWRNAFDGDLLYIADVGQNAWEEIDVVGRRDAGANLGWNTMEGRECYPAGAVCVQGGFVVPIHVYSHDEGCSITGGLVYRGAALPALQGRYFFADYCSGVVQSLRFSGGAASDLASTADDLGSLGSVTSFGTDAAGELHVLTDDGQVLKMVAAD
ncbi:MAG: PQQ-dependent sugar dehydrogenase [Devosia nanyangense]|uniref:PQQ-dependent sugar dehydrogenase n=1 Tax=Devosia nanyangense TaxID=1228055 RepID=A0A933KYC2_9HYPH|nr:PQQ-dependent sugar dehydrogenase [Devosia nanyangense]